MEVYRIETRDQKVADSVYARLLPYGLLASGDDSRGFVFFLPQALTFEQRMKIISCCGARLSGPEAARAA